MLLLESLQSDETFSQTESEIYLGTRGNCYSAKQGQE